jgi:hypothetical protein
MHIRHNKILKFLAIILFSFELLAPSAFASTFTKDVEVDQPGKNILIAAPGSSLFTFLLFEEIGEEGREGRDDAAFSFVDLYASQFYRTPSITLGIELSLANTKRMFDTSTPLFKLHGVFLI